MIQLICGKKGSGKTKQIIEMVSSYQEPTLAVYLCDSNRYVYEIPAAVRFINTQEYDIEDQHGLSGFIRGLLAGNSDIKKIYVDGASRMTNSTLSEMQPFFNVVEKLTQTAGVDFVFTISEDEEKLPAFLKKFIFKK